MGSLLCINHKLKQHFHNYAIYSQILRLNKMIKFTFRIIGIII